REAFFAPRYQVLLRHWERTQAFTPTDAVRNDNELLRDIVLWIDRHYLVQVKWELPIWTASEAVVGWLEGRLRRRVHDVIDDQLVNELLQELSAQGIDIHGVRPRLLREVLIRLVREAVPLGGRWRELVGELRSGSPHPDVVTQNLRRRLGAVISERL